MSSVLESRGSVLRLADCGTLLTGGTPSRSEPDFWNGDLPWISAKSLKKFEVLDSDDKLTSRGAAAGSVVPPGAVLFVVRGMSLANEFRVGVAGRSVAFNQDLRALVPNDRVDSRYLARFLEAEQETVLGMVDEASHGTKRLTSDRFENIAVPVPALAEQRRIATLLDRAEALRAKRRAALRLVEDLPQVLFQELFGDHESVLREWPTIRLGDALEFLTSGSRGWAANYVEAGDLFLRIQNVGRDELLLDDLTYVRAPNTAEARRTLVQTGDVLMSITADLGRTAVVPDDLGPAFINQHLSILRTRDFVPRFLSAYLTSPAGRRQVSSRNRQAVKAGLNFEDIRSLVVPFPPTSLQRQFATNVGAVERLRAAHNKSLAELDALFASLQHRAFRSEL